MSVLCTYCNEFSIDDKFCSKCGKKIKRDIGKWKISIDNKLLIDTTLKQDDNILKVLYILTLVRHILITIKR